MISSLLDVLSGTATSALSVLGHAGKLLASQASFTIQSDPAPPPANLNQNLANPPNQPKSDLIGCNKEPSAHLSRSEPTSRLYPNLENLSILSNVDPSAPNYSILSNVDPSAPNYSDVHKSSWTTGEWKE